MSVIPNNEAHLPQRLVALVVSVLVALAAGTPYLYGVFAPQLVQRCGLTTSDSASISLASNLGSGVGGLPAGLIIDHYGPAVSILFGSISIFIGYYGLYRIYLESVPSLALICGAMGFVGFGSIICFFATLKAAQANFPKHRGAAGAFPVSAYGLSATIFLVIAATAFNDDTAGLLLFLSLFCGSVAFVGSFFVNIHWDHSGEDEELDDISKPTDEESPLSGDLEYLDDPNQKSIPLHKTRSLAGSFSFWGIGERTPRNSVSTTASEAAPILQGVRDQNEERNARNNTFLQGSSAESERLTRESSFSDRTPLTRDGSFLEERTVLTRENSFIQQRKTPKLKSPLVTIKERLTNKIFLTHYLVVALASGIGQMYIYSVGFIVTAQYNYDAEHDFGGDSDVNGALVKLVARVVSTLSGGPPLTGGAAKLQALQVSLISIASFSGRLFSGILSDLLHKNYHVSRLWIVTATALLLSVGQLITLLNVNNPHLVTLASTIIGLSYGLIFGTYPAVIADKFGTNTFSTTWGLICTGPLIVLFTLNKYFGRIYDAHTDPATGICYEGNGCYKDAFLFSYSLCFVIFSTTLILIWIQRTPRL